MTNGSETQHNSGGSKIGFTWIPWVLSLLTVMVTLYINLRIDYPSILVLAGPKTTAGTASESKQEEIKAALLQFRNNPESSGVRDEINLDNLLYYEFVVKNNGRLPVNKGLGKLDCVIAPLKLGVRLNGGKKNNRPYIIRDERTFMRSNATLKWNEEDSQLVLDFVTLKPGHQIDFTVLTYYEIEDLPFQAAPMLTEGAVTIERGSWFITGLTHAGVVMAFYIFIGIVYFVVYIVILLRWKGGVIARRLFQRRDEQ